MQLPSWTTTALGVVAVGAVLVLHWPGVEVARADEQVRSEAPMSVADPAAGPSCSAARAVPDEAKVGAVIAELQQHLGGVPQTSSPTSEPYPEVTMLNGRGYNYGGDEIELPSLDEVRREVRHSD